MSNNLAFIVWFTNLSIKLCLLQNLMLKNIKYIRQTINNIICKFNNISSITIYFR